MLVLAKGLEFRRQAQMIAGARPVSKIVGAVVFAGSWNELRELARRHPDSPMVVDPALAEEDRPFALPAPLPSTGDRLRDMRSAILRAIDPERPRRLLAQIHEQAAPEAGRIMSRVLDRSFEATAVPALARDLGMPHWALIRRCAALAVPTPKKLINLGRIYTVERIAEWSGTPSGVAAEALGFLDPAVYRRMVRRALQAPPSALRQMGGAAYVGRMILATLAPSGDRRRAHEDGV